MRTIFIADLRYALRQLRKAPGFTVIAVLTLAVGIGASAAIFSVFDAVLLRPLPFKDVDRIVEVQTKAAANFRQPASWPEYLDMRRLNTTFSVLAGVGYGGGVTLTQGNQAIYLHAVQGTDNFFDLFGVKPLLGRTYLPGEDQNGKNDVAVLSYSLWQQYFGGKKSILGQTVHLNGSPYTVIGVMPAGFRFGGGMPNVIYTPLHLSADQIKSRGSHWLATFGRLKPGITVAKANADMNHVLTEMGKQFPGHEKGRTARVIPIAQVVHGSSVLSELWMLLGAVLALLLIACTNVAGLSLARGLRHEREMAVRAALGAGRKRLVRQMLTESVLLGIGGGVCGLAIAKLLLVAMSQFLEKAFARGGDVHLNLQVLGVTFAISLLASVAAGLVPAWRAARIDPNNALKAGGSAGTTRHQHRLRASFVVVQVALSLMLLACSGLLLMGLRSMLERNFGFNPKHLLTLEVDLPKGNTGKNFVQALIQPLEARVHTIPGVTAVGSNNQLPIQNYGSNSDLAIVGKPVDPLNRQRLTEVRFVTPGYFAAMQLPILKGRDFTAQDAAHTQPVAIVNTAWVKEFLSSKEDPLAQAFAADNPSKPNCAIVGIARSGRQNITRPPEPEADFPMTQMPESWKAFIPSVYLFVRTSVPPTSIIPQLRKALHDVAPEVAFRTPETMEQVLSDALITNRMLSWLFGLFAVLALLLTAIGIYGLLSQEVASRVRDIGVRIALGAGRGNILRLVLRRAAGLLAVGLLLGIVGAYFATRLVRGFLSGVHPHDWATIAAVCILLAVVGLLASYIPARRAARIEPTEALRSE